MRSCRNAAGVFAMVIVLTTPALAGIMWTDKPSPPPPPPPASSAAQTGTTDCVMRTDGATNACEPEFATEAADTATEAALSLLRSVLSLF